MTATGSTDRNSLTVQRFVLPPTLRSYQIDLIDDPGDEVVCVSSTQVGKTFAYGCKTLAFLWTYDGNHPFWWCAPTYSQSKAAQRVMWQIAHSAGIMKSGPRPPFKSNPPPPMVLINGSICEFRTWDNPDHLMGDPICGATIDEGGLLPSHAHAAISTRRSFTLGPLWWIGNPGRVSGPFRKVCAKAEKENRLHRWTWETLYEHYLEHDPNKAQQYKHFIDQERETLPDFEFRRLYEAVWTEDESAVFRGLEGCLDGNSFIPASEDRFVLGVDVAQTVDYLAIVSAAVKSRRLELRDRFRGIGYPQAAQRIQAISKELNDAHVVVEENGPGIALIQELQRLGVGLTAFRTTQQSKQEAILALAADVQNSRIRIAEHQPMPYEFSVFRYERTTSGLYRYSAPDGEHDDTVMAAAFARWGMSRCVTDYEAVMGWA